MHYNVLILFTFFIFDSVSLHFFHITLFWCCIRFIFLFLFMLLCFHDTSCLCLILPPVILEFLHVAVSTFSTFLLFCFFHIALFLCLHYFCVALYSFCTFSCCILFMLQSLKVTIFHVVFFSFWTLVCCTFSMLHFFLAYQLNKKTKWA